MAESTRASAKRTTGTARSGAEKPASRPPRMKSRLSQQHPVHVSGESATAEELAVINAEDEKYPDDGPTGRLTIDMNRNLRRDLKAWVVSQDGTIADVVRAIAKLMLSEEDSEGRREIHAAIAKEIAARYEREDIKRRLRLSR